MKLHCKVIWNYKITYPNEIDFNRLRPIIIYSDTIFIHCVPISKSSTPAHIDNFVKSAVVSITSAQIECFIPLYRANTYILLWL